MDTIQNLACLRFIQILLISFTMSANSAELKGRESNKSPLLFHQFDPLQVSQENDLNIFSKLPLEHLPLGIRTGNFYLFPELTISESYADNIFFSSSSEQSDLITVVSPRIQYRSGWENHALNFYGTLDYGHFKNHQSEDFYDISLGSDGIFDVKRDLNFNAGIFFDRQHELRGNPNAVNDASQPTVFYRYRANIGLYKQFNRVSFTLDSKFTQFKFQSNQSLIGGIIENKERDRKEYSSTFQLNYESQKINTLFIRGTYTKRDYDQEQDLNGFNRDSEGIDVVAGTFFNFSDILYGNIFFGYTLRNFSDSNLEKFLKPTFGADFTWLPTETLKAVATIISETRETTRLGSSNIKASALQLSLSHELHHDFFVEYKATVLNERFIGSSREDFTYLAGLHAKYVIYNGVFFSMGYDFSTRKSSISQSGYTVNMVTVNFEAHY